MDKSAPTWQWNGYTLRPATTADAEAYYAQNYAPLDPEVARLTGCKPEFTREEVVASSCAVWRTATGTTF